MKNLCAFHLQHKIHRGGVDHVSINTLIVIHTQKHSLHEFGDTTPTDSRDTAYPWTQVAGNGALQSRGILALSSSSPPIGDGDLQALRLFHLNSRYLLLISDSVGVIACVRVCVRLWHFVFSLIDSGLRNSSNLWRRSLDLDRLGMVLLRRVVRSKEDLKEDWERDEGEEEESVFWNPLDRLKDLRSKVCSQPVLICYKEIMLLLTA